jgi:pyrroline-5-carboxylate reductase
MLLTSVRATSVHWQALVQLVSIAPMGRAGVELDEIESLTYPCRGCRCRPTIAAEVNRAVALMERNRALDRASMACFNLPREYAADE